MKLRLFTDMERCTPEEVQRLLPLVSDQRREEALRFKHTFGQFACLISYLLLHQLLEEQQVVGPDEPLHFVTNAHGKPRLSGHEGAHFSISHCREAIAAATDSQPVGVDVERFINPSNSLLRYCMNDSEADEVRQSPHPDRAFALLWTQKEAIAKQRGTGIQDDIKRLRADCPSQVQVESALHATFALSTAVLDPGGSSTVLNTL